MWRCFGREREAARHTRKADAKGFVGVQEVKARGFVGTREMEAGFGCHGIEVLQTAGIWELNSPVASLSAVAGLENHALIPRIGVGLAQGPGHCMMQMVVFGILGTEVGFAAVS